MSAFLKTLFGDVGTVLVAAIVIAVELLLVASGQVAWAAYVVPPCALAGAAWLATR
jgi:hypothetical protein